MTLFKRNPATFYKEYTSYDPPDEPVDPPGGQPWHPTGYGLLYNFYAVEDARNMAPTGWEVWDHHAVSHLVEILKDLEPIEEFPLVPKNKTGGKVKSIWTLDNEGFPGWTAPNGGASNNASLFFLPNGTRAPDGIFYNAGFWAFIHINRTLSNGTPFHLRANHYGSELTYHYKHLHYYPNRKNRGCAVRCYAPKDVGESNGDTGTFTYEDYTYRYVVWGDYKYMMENLRVTKYRNGSNINYITDNELWRTTQGGAWCMYNNRGSI